MQSTVACLSLGRYKLIQQLEASPVSQNRIYLFLLGHILLCMRVMIIRTYLPSIISPFCGLDTKQRTIRAFFYEFTVSGLSAEVI